MRNIFKKIVYYTSKILFILFTLFGIVGIIVGISSIDLFTIVFYAIWTVIGAFFTFIVSPFILNKLNLTIIKNKKEINKASIAEPPVVRNLDTVNAPIIHEETSAADNKNIVSTTPVFEIPAKESKSSVEISTQFKKGQEITNLLSSYVVIDVETTGFSPTHDSLIEVAALKIRDDKIIGSYASLINPERKINSSISNLTGITNEELEEAPSAPSVLPLLYDFISDSVLVGHNVTFDIKFLGTNFDRYLSKPLCNNYIDTLALSRANLSLSSYKLASVAEYFKIKSDTTHRALSDCNTTHLVYQALKSNAASQSEIAGSPEDKLLASLNYDKSNPFYNKRIAVKGKPQLYSYNFMQALAKKCSANMSDVFYSTSDYIIFGKHTYKRFVDGADSNNFIKAKQLADQGTLTILSEEQFYSMLNVPLPSSASSVQEPYISEEKEHNPNHPLFGKVCVFTGNLKKYSRNQASKIVTDLGGQVGSSVTKKTNYLIFAGHEDYSILPEKEKSSKLKRAEILIKSGQDLQILSESEFYDMIP